MSDELWGFLMFGWVFMIPVLCVLHQVAKQIKRVADELAYPRERREELLTGLKHIRAAMEVGCMDRQDEARLDAIREELAALGGRGPWSK